MINPIKPNTGLQWRSQPKSWGRPKNWGGQNV